MALSIAERGAELTVEDLSDGRWCVRGGKSGQPHVVEADRYGQLWCDAACKGFTFRSKCRHVDAVRASWTGSDLSPRETTRDGGPGLERDVALPESPFDDELL